MALVMYDLDGTLLDTAGEITDAVNRTLALYDQPAVDEAQVRTWIGHGTTWLMKQAWHTTERIPAPAWDEVMNHFTRHYIETVGTTSQLYPFVRETLDKVKKKGIKQAVITNKEQQFTEPLLKQHGLADFFDLIISGDTLAVKKPNPQVIHYCLNTLRESSASSLFVGDSEIDVATAKSAGVLCWAVPYGYNAGRDIRLANPDRLIEDIREVPDFLIKIMAI